MAHNDNMNGLMDKIEKLVSTIENNYANQITESNRGEWGKFISTLTALRDSLVDGGIDRAKIFEGMNESLFALESSTESKVKNVISEVSGSLVEGFKEFDKITPDIKKDISSTLNNTVSTLSKTFKVATKGIKRETDYFVNQVGESFTAIPKRMQDGISQESFYKTNNKFLSDEIFKRTDVNPSARRNALYKMVSGYRKKSLISDEQYESLINEIEGSSHGLSDTEYKKIAGTESDPFRVILSNLNKALNHEGRLANTVRKNITKEDIRGYEDIINGESEVANAFLDKITGFQDLLNGNYIKQRVKQIGGKADSIKTLDLTQNFKNAMSVLEKSGIGTHIEQTTDGVKFGLFDAKNANDVLSTVDGKVVADWGKMATYTMGIPTGKDGSVKINGMQFADQFRTTGISTPMGDDVGLTTVSQQLMEMFFNSIVEQAGKPTGLIGKIKANDLHAASQEMGRFAMDIVHGAYGANKFVDSKGASTNVVYKDLPNLAKDLQDDTYAGSSLLQRILRSNRFDTAEWLRGQYAKTFGVKTQDVTSGDLERMMNYIYAQMSSPEAVNILKSNEDYKDLFDKGAHFLNPTAQLLKQAAPHFGISSLKEGNYLFGQIAGLDSGIINPFNPFISGSYRGVSQGANYIKAASNRDGKNSLFSKAFLRSDLLENLGLDYSQAEQKVVNMAEINDETIYNALKGYYETLGSGSNDIELKSLYKKYISKKYNGEDINGSFGMTDDIRQNMVKSLQGRIMPSVYNGGMILSEGIRKDSSGYASRRMELTAKDVSKLGVSMLPDELSPTHRFTTDKDRSITNQLKLSGGILGKNDKLNSVSYENGKYYLDYDKYTTYKESPKVVTGAGGRFTTSKNNILTKGEFNAVLDSVGLSNGMKIGALVEATKDDPRKIASQTGETWEGLFQQARLLGKSNETIRNALESKGLIKDDNTGFFRQSKDGGIYSNFQTKSSMESMAKQSGINLKDLYYTGFDSMFHDLAKTLLGEDMAESFIRNRVHATTLNHANEHSYFDPIGSVTDEEAKRSSHVKLTPREVEATSRNIGMLRSISDKFEQADAYQTMMNRYMQISDEDQQISKNLFNSLNKAYRMSTQASYAKKNAPEDMYMFKPEDYETLTSTKTYREGGTLDQTDYENTVLGKVSQSGLQFGKLSLGKEIDLGNGVKVSDLYIPNLGDRKMSDGTFSPYGKIESALQSVIKGIQDMDEGTIEAPQMIDRIGRYYAALKNEMESADGTFKQVVNGKKLANAGALKATPANLKAMSNIGENTIVVNDEYLKKMLLSGDGASEDIINKNIGNLETLYRMMQSEADNTEYSKDDFNQKFLQGLNNGKILEYEKALVNKIVNMTSAESGSVGLQSLFHRYPFTQGLDNKNIRVRTSKNVEFGQFMASRGLAEQVNLDYDGDTSYLKNPYLSAENPDQLENAYKAGRELTEINDFVTKQLARTQDKDAQANSHDKDKFNQAFESLVGGQGSWKDYITSVLSKGNFQHVGRLSNFAEYVRNGLSKNYLDENGGKVASSGRATVMRALFEQLEQDAISSKKVSQRLQEITGGDITKINDSTLEKAVNDQLSSVGSLIDDMKGWANGSLSEEEFIKRVKSGGFIDFDSSNRTTREAQARIEKMLQLEGAKNGANETWYEQQLKELGLWESRMTKFNGKDYYENENAGVFNMQTYMKNLKILKDNAPDLYKEGMRAAYERKGSYEINSQKAIEQVVKQAGGYVSTVGDSLSNVTGIDKANLYLERLVEVIENLGSASQNTANGVSAAKTAIDQMRTNREMVSGIKSYNVNGMSLYSLKAKQNAGYGQNNNHLYDINGSDKTHQDYSVTQLSGLLTGSSSVYTDDGLAIKNAIQKRKDQLAKALLDNRDQDAILNDYLNYEDFGFDNREQMLKHSKGLVSSEFGTLQHATTEYSNEISKMLFVVQKKLGVDTDIGKKIGSFLNGDIGYSSILGLMDTATEISSKHTGTDIGKMGDDILSMITKLQGLGASYKNTLRWLGIGESDIQGDFTYLDDVSNNLYQWMHSGNRQVVSTEQAMGMRAENKATGQGFNIAGAVDTMVYDESNKELLFLDNKNTGNISPQNIMQQLIYQLMGESLQAHLRGEINQWKSGADLKYVQDGEITDKGYEYLAGSEHSMDFQWASGNKALIRALYEGNIKTAFAHNKKDGFTSIQDIIGQDAFVIDSLKKFIETGEVLNDNEKNALKRVVSKFAREGGFLGEGNTSRFAWLSDFIDDVTGVKDKKNEAWMKTALKSQGAYNNAELNMQRANKALEKAYLSGNPQAIAAAEQQLEGARLQAQIASQHKAQFVAVDANGKIIQTTNENGRPISLEQLKKSGVDIDNMQGMARVWNAESGDWENVKLNAAQTKQHVTEISEQWSKHQQLVGKVHAPVKTLGSLVGEVLGGIKQTTAYLMRTSLVYGIIGKVKQAFSTLVQTVKALNKSYVDLRIASGQTDSQMKDTIKIYSQMASEMGKTTQEVAAAANDWLRAGYNAEESAKLIKNSMQLSTVGMIESAKATEYLISTMKGWKLGVDDMEGVIDKMSELDRNAAISAGDIAEAMSRANVSAQLAGSELNKYMSYITTVSDVSQMSAETVGTA